MRCTAVLAIVSSFSLLYGIISYSFAYYGEMMTYLGMTLPMDVLSLTAWLENPYNGNRSEVRVSLKPCHLIKMQSPKPYRGGRYGGCKRRGLSCDTSQIGATAHFSK